MQLVGRVVDISRSERCGPHHQQGLVIGWNENVHVGPLVNVGRQGGRGPAQRADGLNVTEDIG